MTKTLPLILVIIASSLNLCHLAQSRSVGEGATGTESSLQDFLDLAQSLKYGDDCSWTAEESRRNLTAFITARNFEGMLEATKDFVKRGDKLCSAAELYVCDHSTQKCVCGDPGYESRLGVDRSLYTLDEDGKCRWNTNSYCVSDESLKTRTMGLITVDSKCKSGTTCATKDGNPCTKQNRMSFLFKNYNLGVLLNVDKLTRELMSGRVCSCQVDQVNPLEDVQTKSSEVEEVTGAREEVTSAPITSSSYYDDEDDVINSIGDDEENITKRIRRAIFNEEGDSDMRRLAKYVAGPGVASYMQ